MNLSVSDPHESEIIIRNARIKSAVAITVTHPDIHAHNTFDQKEVVTPQTKPLEISSASLNHTFPPASVTKLAINSTSPVVGSGFVHQSYAQHAEKQASIRRGAW